MTDSNRDQVFISYSHQDEKWRNDLLTHLKPYLRAGSITAWSDKKIEPGSKWFEDIKEALNRSVVAVLLVTPNFLASDFINEQELTPLLKNAESGGVKILWIHVRACSYRKSPIRSYQAVIDPDKPLAQMKADRDRAWVAICNEIEIAISSSVSTPQEDSDPAIAGRVNPGPKIVHSDVQPLPHRPLLLAIERSVSVDGKLNDSTIAPIVYAALSNETELELVKNFNPSWMMTGIRLSDEYLVRVGPSAGERDWQRDFAQTATPTLVGITHSLKRSDDAEALVIQLCNLLAKRLRLRLIWPDDADERNDRGNRIYKACLGATELESDLVLMELKGLTVVGPE